MIPAVMVVKAAVLGVVPPIAGGVVKAVVISLAVTALKVPTPFIAVACRTWLVVLSVVVSPSKMVFCAGSVRV